MRESGIRGGVMWIWISSPPDYTDLPLIECPSLALNYLPGDSPKMSQNAALTVGDSSTISVA